MLDANGRTRWIRARCVPDLNFDGTVKGEYVVGHDITDLKLAQDALAARESQLRAIMDGVPAPVAYIDREEHCHYVNRTFLQYFGLTAAQVAELRLRDVVGHGIYQSAQAMLTRALEGESTAFDRLVPGANGVRRWMTIRVVPDAGPSGEVHGAFVLMNDIHGLKQAQEALRASEAELRLIMDNVPARVSLHRSRLPLSLPQPPQRGVAGREPQGARRAARCTRSSGEQRFTLLQPLLDRVLEGETVSTELMLPQPNGEHQVGRHPLRAQPRHRRQRRRHLRRAHRRARPEAQRGSAAPRQLDALVAHQQHAAGGAGVGPRPAAHPLVAAGREHLRLDAATRSSACRSPTTR